VDYNRFGLLDKKLRLMNDDGIDFSASMRKHPSSTISFSLVPSKGADSKNTSLLTGLAIRYVQGLGTATKLQSRTVFQSVVKAFTADVHDDAMDDSVSPKKSKSIRHLDSLGAIVTPDKDYKGVNYYANEWEDPKYDEGSTVGLPDLPDRPWEWEVDAQLLEDLAQEDKDFFDLDGIQARAIAPLESFSIHSTMQKLHDSNKDPVAAPPSRDRLQSIKLHRQKLMLRQSSLLGVLEAGSEDERSDMGDEEHNIDRNDEYLDDEEEEEEDGEGTYYQDEEEGDEGGGEYGGGESTVLELEVPESAG
jgi:hypothetical protein